MLSATGVLDVVNTKTVSFLLLLAIAGLSSCIGQDPSESSQDTSLAPLVHFDFGQPMGMTRAEYADFLVQEATDLARAELARLSAIELMYRDKTYLHKSRMQMGPQDITALAYAKVYRQFTDSRLVDITSSESILRPLIVTIDFDYDVLASEPIQTQGRDPQKALTAQNRKTYSVSRSETTRFVYNCDEEGRPLALPPPLPRPNIWDDGMGNGLTNYGLEEALGPNTGLEILTQ